MADPAAGARSKKRVKLSRAEKSQQIRESLFTAAAKVVGQEGYTNTMVSTITAQANVAQGTFYNYFESKQDLFDQLLPALGREMLDFIREEVTDITNALEREERSFRAFFTFLKIRPEFYRILYEAEVFAPAGFKQHMKIVSKGYISFLKEALARGELKAADDRELEPIAYMLMGIRHYLCMRFARIEGETNSLPEWIIRTYMDTITSGTFVAPSPVHTS
jgi:AcrR family transcriptional regulator